MTYSYYITPGEYEIAQENGISKRQLEKRVRNYGWKIERAINEPPQKKRTIPKEIIQRAEANGISYSTLRQRIHRFGWEHERACTEPLQDRKKQAVKMQQAMRKHPIELVKQAEKNGIKYDTFISRVNKYGWNIHEAATKPTMTKREIGLLSKARGLF